VKKGAIKDPQNRHDDGRGRKN